MTDTDVMSMDMPEELKKVVMPVEISKEISHNFVAGHWVKKGEEGPKVLLLGLPGAGKTSAIATALLAGLEVFVIFTEQGKDSLLERALEHEGITKEMRKHLYWNYVGASTPGWKGLLNFAKEVNASDQKTLQSAKGSVLKEHQQLLDMIRVCSNFVDQNGKEWGDISQFDNNKFVAIDGLSGLNDMCMDIVVGAKVIRTIADWGMAMETQMKFIKQVVNDLTCGACVIGHIELNKDEVDGRIYRLPKILGNKNSGDFGKFFSDVILAKDLGTDYVWSTQENQMQLKTRNLKKSGKLPPDFLPLFKNWAERYERMEEEGEEGEE